MKMRKINEDYYWKCFSINFSIISPKQNVYIYNHNLYTLKFNPFSFFFFSLTPMRIITILSTMSLWFFRRVQLKKFQLLITKRRNSKVIDTTIQRFQNWWYSHFVIIFIIGCRKKQKENKKQYLLKCIPSTLFFHRFPKFHLSLFL